MLDKLNPEATTTAGLVTRPALTEAALAEGRYAMTCIGPDGSVKWTHAFDNVVTTAGKNDMLDKYLAGSAYSAVFYLGLKGTGTAAAADTLASHAGWTEVTPYSGNRPAVTWASASAGSKATNQVAFSITATATVAGAFLATAASGTSGVLLSAGDFTASRSVASGDTLNVTYTLSV